MDWDNVLLELQNPMDSELNYVKRNALYLERLNESQRHVIKTLEETIVVLKSYVDWDKIREMKQSERNKSL